MFYMNSIFRFYRDKSDQFWPKSGPNLDPNGQTLIKRPREPNKQLFHMFLSTEYIFFMKILNLYFSGAKPGPNVSLNGQT